MLARAWREGMAVLAVAGVLALAATADRTHAAQDARPAAASSPVSAADQAVFTRYCLTCHTDVLRRRGTVPAAFETLDVTRVARDAKAWEAVLRKMRSGLMPPAGMPRPDRATHDAFVRRIEDALDAAAAARPDPGRTEPLHRLNRIEYRNAVRDLLGLDVNVASLLPPDDVSYGFDNVAGVLKMSPTLMERYLAAAQKVSRLAIGTPPPAPVVDYYRLSDDLRQDAHLEAQPLGTRGGTTIRHTFPLDGEYVIKPRLARDLNENVPVYLEPQTLEVSLDGERIELLTVPGAVPAPARGRGAGAADAPAPASPSDPGQNAAAGPRPRPAITQIDAGIRVTPADREKRNHVDDAWDVRVRVSAGPRDVTLAFLRKTAALDETIRLPFARPYPAGVNIAETRMGLHLRSVEIVGPYNPAGAEASPSRRQIFSCTPRRASEEPEPASAEATARSRRSSPEIRASEDGCARTILASLARRAYRRPVAAGDVEPLLAMYRDGRTQGQGFEAGIELAVRRLLVSPEFLYRVERDPAGRIERDRGVYRISDLELASRLSFFLWSSIPDETLLDLAARRQLGRPAVLEAQVTRMLADPRADAFIESFAGQWLYLRNLPAVGPVATIFPDFDEGLRQSLRRETELFFASIVREDRPAADLLTANYTFLDERLARHYGVPGVKGSHFRRVSLPADSARAGLLGHGSILTVTSQPDRTSPVVRGKWILENFLGTSPPAPPPNVPDLKSSVEPGAVLSMRERMVAHRANPACAGCHAMMDPIGLSLENFDAVGRFRTLGESGGPIDASGSLPDGTRFSGAAGLREALLTRREQFVTTLTEKLLTYALGRGVEYYDQPAVRTIVRDAAAREYRFATLVAGVVRSTPFQMRRTRS
jgi:cytochrome c5